MQILVVSATELEIAPFLAGQTGIDHLITGVGGHACLYYLQTHLQKKNYELAIQAGIAGSFSDELSLGETVLVEKDVFADLGVFEHGELKTLFDMGLANKNEWPYQEGWLLNDHPLLSDYKLKKVAAASVNSLSDDRSLTALYKNKFNAAVESMEGAAFHYTCLQQKIPFLQLRSISNRVGDRDKNNWKMMEAIKHLNDELKALIQYSRQQDLNYKS